MMGVFAEARAGDDAGGVVPWRIILNAPTMKRRAG